jgi:hypothetical protein
LICPLVGGGGGDKMWGGPGDDLIDARDNLAFNDTIDGGIGTDTAWIDSPGEYSVLNCEYVIPYAPQP